MYALDGDCVELALRVRAHHERHVQRDEASKERASHDKADATYVEVLVDEKFDRLLVLANAYQHKNFLWTSLLMFLRRRTIT